MSDFIRSKLPNTGTTIFTVMSAMANEYGAINLSQGFPNFDVDPRLKDLVSHYIQAGYNQYAPLAGIPELRVALAKKVELSYKTQLDPDHEITITAGATQAIFTAIAATIHPGDEVIVFDPSYDSYAPSVQSFGGIVVPIALKAPKFDIDWDEVNNAITAKTKLLIINSPHNPTGKVLRATDIEALKEIVEKHPILLLSDEVYEHLIFDDLPHLSILKEPALFARSFVTFSFGKSMHATGWKLGYCIAPTPLSTEFRKIHQFNVFCVNRPLQHAIADYIEDAKTYSSLGRFYQEKRDYFSSQMEQSRFQLIPSEGSYFILADYSAMSNLNDRNFTAFLTKEKGVATIPLSPFYMNPPQDQRIIRFCFAKTLDLLEEATLNLKHL
jgi:methionine aminotransferase